HLADTFDHLKLKHQLVEIEHNWKKLRTRPFNFPHVRLSQLAATLFKSPDIFNQILTLKTIDEFKNLFSHPVSAYWHTHLDFNQKNEHFNHAVIGIDSVHNLIINVVAPLKIFYGKTRYIDELVDEAINLLDMIPSEKNQIISLMKSNGFESKKASQSQGLIQLNKQYCTMKKCLNCSIGNHILTQTNDNY
ncbi:MAG: DUF2851 family protein, partial [Cytophagales bacterium]